MSNISNIIYPSDSAIAFFYYYSTFTTFLSWTLAPLLFYSILTQSNSIGPLKWLILNYSIWSLILTSLWGTMKPVILSPAFGAIHIGIFQNIGGHSLSLILYSLLIALNCTCICAVVSAMGFRYVLVFPSKLKDIFTFKVIIFVTIFLTAISFALLLTGYFLINNFTAEEIHAMALTFDPQLKIFFANQSFYMAPLSIVKNILKIAVGIFYAFHIGYAFILLFLRHQMSKYRDILKGKANYNLIKSIIVQGVNTVFLLVTPYTIILSLSVFEIPNSSTIALAAECCSASHCFVDYLATLYVMSPYRKFVVGLFWKGKTTKVLIAPSNNTVPG